MKITIMQAIKAIRCMTDLATQLEHYRCEECEYKDFCDGFARVFEKYIKEYDNCNLPNIFLCADYNQTLKDK
jgi:DNA polymerase III alpha subunit (gram-positive type)